MPKTNVDLNNVAVEEIITAMDGTDQPPKEVPQDTDETEETTEEAVVPEEEIEETSEDDVDTLKAKLAKSEKDRDNYRRGMLSAQAKNRELPVDVESKQKKEEGDDVIEQKVHTVLAKREQRIALTQVLDPKDAEYIPELSDKEQYREILEYLPQRYDRTSAKDVKRALRAATVAWRFDRGILEPKKKMHPINDTGLGGGDSSVTTKRPEPMLNIPKAIPMAEWFK